MQKTPKQLRLRCVTSRGRKGNVEYNYPVSDPEKPFNRTVITYEAPDQVDSLVYPRGPNLFASRAERLLKGMRAQSSQPDGSGQLFRLPDLATLKKRAASIGGGDDEREGGTRDNQCEVNSGEEDTDVELADGSHEEGSLVQPRPGAVGSADATDAPECTHGSGATGGGQSEVRAASSSWIHGGNASAKMALCHESPSSNLGTPSKDAKQGPAKKTATSVVIAARFLQRYARILDRPAPPGRDHGWPKPGQGKAPA